MPICGCKNTTHGFCFVHHAHVCPDCITTHPNCVCGMYVEWLNDPDYSWPPTCEMCAAPLAKDATTLRLPCLHMVHVQCARAAFDALPASTAPAGYACPLPACAAPVVPPPADASALAAALRTALADSAWWPRIEPLVAASGAAGGFVDRSLAVDAGWRSSVLVPKGSSPRASPSPRSAKASPSLLPSAGYVGVLGSAAASRKPPALDFTSQLALEDTPVRPSAHRAGSDDLGDDDHTSSGKYRKRSLWRSLSAYIPCWARLEAYFAAASEPTLPITAPGTPSATAAPPASPMRAYVVGCLIFLCFVLFVFVGMSMRSPSGARDRVTIVSARPSPQ